MSDARVWAAVATIESWLADPAWEPTAEALTDWNAEFQLALERAEHGADWEGLAARAHAAGAALEARLAGLIAQRDALKAELGAQARGDRALRGYGSNAR